MYGIVCLYAARYRLGFAPEFLPFRDLDMSIYLVRVIFCLSHDTFECPLV